MSEIKLLPCPFCGGEAELVRQHSGVSDKIYIVSCKNEECEASLGHFCESKEMAIESWNTRKPMERIVTKLKEARAECKELQRSTTDAYGYMKMKRGIDCGIDIVKEEGGIE